MSTKRLTEEPKVEAMGQLVHKGYLVAEAAARLGVSQHSLYQWIKQHKLPVAERQAQVRQSDEVRRLRGELKRVTEERDILKMAAVSFAKQSG